LIRRVAPVAVFAVALAAYFLYFNRGALNVHFAPDDMMNLSQYFRWPRWQIWIAQITPWRGYYRPLAGAFYMPLLYICGLNPRPYHAVLLFIGLAALYLVYLLARQLGANPIAAYLAPFLLAFHAGISNLYFDIAFVYDALCGFFYLAALCYYIRLRRPTFEQAAIFLALFLCALNSKEMAATLPAILVAYDLLYRDKPLWPVILPAFALDALFAYGKLFGPAALIQSEGYVMAFTRQRLVNFQTEMLSDLSLAWHHIEWPIALVVYAIGLGIALWMRRRIIWFGFIFVLVTPLPIEFLEGRRQATLFIPAVGVAVFASETVVHLAQLLGLQLAREIGLRGMLARAVPLIALAVAFCGWFARNREIDRLYVQPAMAELGGPTWSLIQQFNVLHPEIPPHGTVAFLDDPFDGWDMQFIAQLWFRDPTLKVLLQRKTPLSPNAIARADHVFNAAEGKLVQVR
jgi:hypothetical protein